MSCFSYIPVIRNRNSEKDAFKTLTNMNVFSSSKIIPLLEIVKPLSGSISYSNSKFPILMDVPTYINLDRKNIDATCKSFLKNINDNLDERINFYINLKNKKNIIPVISYNPLKSPQDKSYITSQEKNLRNDFKNLAFRVFIDVTDDILLEIENIIQEEDILILDIDENSHTDTNLKSLYKKIYNMKSSKKCITVILNSPIKNSLRLASIPNDTPSNTIDNSLIFKYKDYKFDAFGDYCGIKKNLPSDGNYSVPIYFLFYSFHDNKFIKFSTNGSRSSRHFNNVISPYLLNSKYWKLYNSQHHENCPGCKEIYNSIDKNTACITPKKRKTIEIAHYIYTLYEFL